MNGKRILKVVIQNNEFSFEGIKLPLPIQYSILMASNKSLENDLEEVIFKIKQIENAQHLWAITWRPIRLDDLQDLALFYFIKEVIDYVKLNYTIDNIILEGEFDSYLQDYLNTNYSGLQIKRKISRRFLRVLIGFYLGPLKYIFKAILKRRKFSKVDAQIWLYSPLNINNHRYRHLLELMNLKKAFFRGVNEDSVDTKDADESINFINYLTFLDVFKSFKMAISLNREKRKIKPVNLIDHAIRNNRIPHFMATILKEIGVANAIKINKPQRILFTTANTYPPARIIARQAYLNQIPFIVVACRPMFTKARLEERLIDADKLKINDAHVADAFAVWDAYSKHTLIEQGVDPNCIYVTNPEFSILKTNKSNHKFENSILLLFAHEEILNQKLIEELCNLKISKNVILREHPLKPLTKIQLEILNRRFNVISDISSKDYANFEFVNVLALTINSTAILEAVSHGCGAIWMPYLNSRSLLFFEIIDQLGLMAENVEDLDNILTLSEDKLAEFISDCQKMYEIKFKAKDETRTFLEQMKLMKT